MWRASRSGLRRQGGFVWPGPPLASTHDALTYPVRSRIVKSVTCLVHTGFELLLLVVTRACERQSAVHSQTEFAHIVSLDGSDDTRPQAWIGQCVQNGGPYDTVQYTVALQELLDETRSFLNLLAATMFHGLRIGLWDRSLWTYNQALVRMW